MVYLFIDCKFRNNYNFLTNILLLNNMQIDHSAIGQSLEKLENIIPSYTVCEVRIFLHI